MKILYYDCFCGISGDMNVGAMLDLGVDKQYLISELSKLNLNDEYEIEVTKSTKNGITGTKFNVILKHHHHHHEHHAHRNLNDIKTIINTSSLNENIKMLSCAMFHKVAEAEAKVHGKPIDEIHFHEVGATDSIVDIVGAAIALDYLKVDKIISSSVQLGGGFVKCAHGTIPIPAPATVEILRNIPTKTGIVQFETTTPTGAAILATNVTEFTDNIEFIIEKTGYGLGTRDLEIPNVLRVYLASSNTSVSTDKQFMIETNIDDMNPEIYSYIEEKLLNAGALDVFKTPIIMKKGRPAVKLSVLTNAEEEQELLKILFTETTSIGVRKLPVEKIMMNREFSTIKTEYGDIAVKFSYYEGKFVKYKAEYEDCKHAAEKYNVTLSSVYHAIDKQIDIDKAGINYSR